MVVAFADKRAVREAPLCCAWYALVSRRNITAIIHAIIGSDILPVCHDFAEERSGSRMDKGACMCEYSVGFTLYLFRMECCSPLHRIS